MRKFFLSKMNKALILTLTDRLESEGFEVDVGDRRQGGFRDGVARTFDLIILDVMLPKKNGYDVCRDLRQKGIGRRS